LSIKIKTLMGVPLARRLVGSSLRYLQRNQHFRAITHRSWAGPEPRFSDLVADNDVVIMKHCFPASDILEDIGKADPASPRQSLENYKVIYRRLRDMFDIYPNKLFIIWTLPPRHRLFELSDGSKEVNAARATKFSNWLNGDFINDGGYHPNIYIWDFRALVMDPNTNFLKYEYESSHHSPDSHPNRLANSEVSPRFAQYIVDAIGKYYGRGQVEHGRKIVFLHHSTGLNIYRYPPPGIAAWFDQYNTTRGTDYLISHQWYPRDGNMPVHYYRNWLEGR
jgi:hypothetical protein